MKLQVSALEARIIRIIVDWYPITVEELRDELSLRKDVLDRTLKSLVSRGLIELEPLSDKTYVRLLASEVDPSVLARTGEKRRPKPAANRSDEDSIMYG